MPVSKLERSISDAKRKQLGVLEVALTIASVARGAIAVAGSLAEAP